MLLGYTDGNTNKSVGGTTFTDGWGNVNKTVDAAGNQVFYGYDSVGRLQLKSNPVAPGGGIGPSTTHSYDGLDRQIRIRLPDSQTVQTSYSGSTVTETDEVGRKEQSQVDGLGRLVSVTEQDPSSGNLTQTTTYSYNYLDKLTQVNQGGQTRAFAYDALGRETYERIPEQTAAINDGTGTMWTCKYTYTDFGAIATKTDARGVVVTYGYDSMNRLVSRSYHVSHATGVAATPAVAYNYDNSSNSSTKGLLLSVTAGSFYTETYGYDGFNRPSLVTDTIDGDNYVTRFQYNQAGQVTQLTYPSGRVLPYVYDSEGRLSSVGGSPNGGIGYLGNIAYAPGGQIAGFSLGNGVNETLTYDPNRLQLTNLKAATSTATLMKFAYNYTAAAGQMGTGTMAGNTAQLVSVSGKINGITESAAYTYDLDRRLATSSQGSNGQTAARSFAWDRWGNRTSETDTTSNIQLQGVTLQQSGGVPTNQIASITTPRGSQAFTYDAAGNVTSDGTGNSYTYDAENRLVSVNGPMLAQYAYNPAHKRIKKVTGGSTTHYMWSGGSALAEHDGTTGTIWLTTYCIPADVLPRLQAVELFTS